MPDSSISGRGPHRARIDWRFAAALVVATGLPAIAAAAPPKPAFDLSLRVINVPKAGLFLYAQYVNVGTETVRYEPFDRGYVIQGADGKQPRFIGFMDAPTVGPGIHADVVAMQPGEVQVSSWRIDTDYRLQMGKRYTVRLSDFRVDDKGLEQSKGRWVAVTFTMSGHYFVDQSAPSR